MKNVFSFGAIILVLLIGLISCEPINDENDCPEIVVNIDNVPGSAVYRFAAQIDGIDDVRLQWSINGMAVDTTNIYSVSDQILEYRFEPGTFDVCVETIDDRCPIKVCKEITVENDETKVCPDLFFDVRKKDSLSLYKFTANFRGVDSLHYEWFINGKVVQDFDSQEGNSLYWKFEEPGEYEVCIKTETPECPEGASYCKELVIEEPTGCPELKFSRDGDYLYANFEGRDTLHWYGWMVNDMHVEDEYLDSNTRDNKFSLENLQKGTYSICIMTETPECPMGTKFCKEISIE